MSLADGTKKIMRDRADVWFRKGERVIINGRTVTGRIWTGHRMAIIHDDEEFTALCEACNIKITD